MHTTKNQQLLQSQMNVEKTHNENSGDNKPLIERKQITNTPFWIIGNDKQGYCLVMGKWKITEDYETIQEVQDQLQSQQWQIIIRMIGIICEDMIKSEDFINNNQQLTTKPN